MHSKLFLFTEGQVYTSLWNKYRPAILQLMIASSEKPQQYKLSSHEFKQLNSREKSFSFSMQVFKGKAVTNIKKSVVAKDLLTVLELSKKAAELMDTKTYEIKLDKQFTLHVTQCEAIDTPTV
jgi:hypothetical protein